MQMFVHSLAELDFTLFYYDSHSSYGELVEHMKQYVNGQPTRLELFIFTHNAPLFSPNEARAIIPISAKAIKLRPRGSKSALVFGRDVLYGLGRVYKYAESRKIIDSPWTIELFKDLDAAIKWLGVSSERVDELILKHNNPTQVDELGKLALR